MMSFGPTFRITGPPRNVPLLVASRLLFGGFLNQFGWLFFGFGMIFFWAFAMNASLTDWLVFRGELETIEGTVTRSEETNASVGGSEHSDGTPVYANHYRFEFEDAQYEGASYATGKRLKPRNRVKIEIPKGDPTHSRIEGMRTAVFGPAVLLVVIFPLVGLCLMAGGARRGLKAVRLLRHGVQAGGMLVSKEPTGTKINDQTVYKLTFDFTAENGQTYQAVAKTHEPAALQDDAEEPLLYYPTNPAYATMLDHLPGSPRIDQSGEIRADGRGSALRVLVLPVVSVVGHTLYAGWRYF